MSGSVRWRDESTGELEADWGDCPMPGLLGWGCKACCVVGHEFDWVEFPLEATLMALYSRTQMEADLAELDRLDANISAAVVIGEPDYFFDAAGGWLLRQPKANPRDPKNWCWKQMHGLLAFRGQLFWTRSAGSWIETQRQRLRMKLLNVGSLLQDKRFAEGQVKSAKAKGLDARTPTERLKRANQNIWANSIYTGNENSVDNGSPDGLSEAFAAAVAQEISLDDPNGVELAKAAQIAGKLVQYRPGGKPIARIYAD